VRVNSTIRLLSAGVTTGALVAVLAHGPGAQVVRGMEGAAAVESRPVGYGLRTMGTWGSVTLVTADSVAAASHAVAALADFVRVDSLMSNWSQDSEVARWNRSAGAKAIVAQPEVLAVLNAALEITAASRGAFDVTVEPLVRAWGFLEGSPRRPTGRTIEQLLDRIGSHRIVVDTSTGSVRYDHPELRIDLGGIAKGHAVDRARATLAARGVNHALVDLSGNMAALGHPPGRDTWVVGVRDPEDRVPFFARLDLQTDAIATSGNYEQFVDVDGTRYGHVLDPRTGWPAEGLDAVTVIASSAREADAWATALLVQGPRKARQTLQDRPDLHGILVQPARGERRVVWVERTLQERFALVRGVDRYFEVRWF
jgi:thiamine biosynthesis lipoprotein